MPPDSGRSLELDVGTQEAGERLDRFLARRVPELSRSAFARLAREREILVDGRRAKASQVLKAGQRVVLFLPDPEPSALTPEPIPLAILYQDEHLAVIDKPAGLVVHPAAGHRDGTLVHALLYHLDHLSGVGGEKRPGIVHRLDKDTSGLLLVAKSDASHRRLCEMLAAHEIRREYLALIWGRLPAAEGQVDAPVGRDPASRKKMAVLAAGGRRALTHYSRVDTLPGFDYIRLELGTGRTHQIRVHMAQLGHPLLGDSLYGGRGSRLRGKTASELRTGRELLAIMARQALHAHRLRFVHPVTGESLAFVSPLPLDMQSALDLLRGAAQYQGEPE